MTQNEKPCGCDANEICGAEMTQVHQENARQNAVHPFERVGLGKAPFRYMGMEVQDIGYGMARISGGPLGKGPDVFTAPGGSCAYCGTYIVQMFNVKSADGRIFHVGSDCVEKVATQNPKHMLGLAALVKRDVAKHRAAQAKKRIASKGEEARAFFATAEVAAYLATQPHRNPGLAAQGKTMADYYGFCSFGNAGIAKEAKRIRAEMIAAAVKLPTEPTSEEQEA